MYEIQSSVCLKYNIYFLNFNIKKIKNKKNNNKLL